jgi:hypothetical protein
MVHRFVSLVVDRPVAIVLAILALTVVLGVQARHLTLEIREKDQLPQDHPYVQLYNRINDLFGGGAVVVVGVIVNEGDVFDPTTLGRIDRITRGIAALPEVDRASGVLSLASPRVKAIRGGSAGLDVHVLMPVVPERPEDVARLRDDVFREPIYVGTLVSEDGRAAAIVAELSVDASYPSVVRRLEKIVAPERDARTTITLGGAPVVLAEVDRHTARMAFLFPLAVVVIGLVHYEAFRTVQAMILPLVTAVLSVVWALGMMGTLRMPLDTWSAMAPVTLLAVAAGHAVQLLRRYYEEFSRLGSSRRAVVASLVAVAPVTVTAGLIAAAGFASLATFRVTSVRAFGLLMAFGIVSALVIELTFIPACRVLLPAPAGREAGRGSPWLTPLLRRLSERVVRRPWSILVPAALLVAFALIGTLRVRVDSSLRGYFSPHSRLRLDDAAINQKFSGASILKLLIEGDADGVLEEPEVLRAVDDLEAFLRRFPEVGKTLSIADHVKRMHRAMHADERQFTAIPDSRALVAQYLLLYSMSGQPDDLGSLVDASYRRAQVLAFTRSDEAAFVHGLVDETQQYVARRFAGLPVTVRVAGGAIGAQAAVNEVIVREKLRNMLQVAAIILILSAVALRSLVGALLVLTPLAVAVAINFGVMGWTETWLSMSTAAVTAMGVSIGADFAIYLLFRVREELATHDLPSSVRRALLTSGSAIFFVSSAVALGYLVLVFSGFAAWIQLGALTALMMAVSAVAAVTVLPALLVVVQPRFLRRLPAARVPDPRAAELASA